MKSSKRFSHGLLLALLAAAVLAGCSSRSVNRAPVEDRGTATGRIGDALGSTAARPLLGIENAGKPGYYTIRVGDTIRRIALETGQDWRDLIQWNNLENPNQIEVGQVIRVLPPVGPVATVTPVGTPVPGTSPVGAVTPPPVAATDDVGFIWPASGALIAGFDDAKNKGLDIAGKVGDAVLAAADGKVVYAGSGLRGYGNLIILKHNEIYLTAYAHNQALLVKEEQGVRKGQKIAEMGSTDADRVKLHFEIRKHGKPIDPARMLPAR